MAESPSLKTLVAPGELRVDLLELFESEPQLDILLAAPGLLPQPPVGHGRVASAPHEPLSVKMADAHRRALLAALGAELDRLPQTAAWQTRVRTWLEKLERADARILHYPAGPLFSRLVSRAEGSVVPPAPLTKELLRREPGSELDLQLSGQAHVRAREWFERHALMADDMSAEVRALLEVSWAGELCSAEDLYYKVLIEFFREMLDGEDITDQNPLLKVMTPFQTTAYQQARGILRRFGGVFLADVVGLGKTYIAMALLRHLQDEFDQHAVVVAPPAVCPAWTQLAEEHGVHLRTVSTGKLEELENYSKREVLVLDESHNFRNPATRRYERLWQWLHPEGLPSQRKVLLLSATPQNNSARDVLQQLRLFPDNFVRLPFAGESLDKFFKAVEDGRESLTTILQHVLVRRTRRFIQTQYPNAQMRVRDAAGHEQLVPIRFPKRVSGPEQCLRYSIEDTYGEGLYDTIMKALAQMDLPLYGLGGYVLEMHTQDPRIIGFRQAGQSLRGLFRVLLLKRLESSEAAFRITLERLRERLTRALEDLRSGFVRLSEELDDDDEQSAETMPSGMFHVDRLRNALQGDLDRVQSLLDALGRRSASESAKLRRLKDYLATRDPRQHRTLLFTQFTDTAEFLEAHLKEEFGRVELVSGRTGRAAQDLAHRFAPRANRKDVPPERQIDLLIATDAFSEGINLQDADTLINYDLHWNPVRLIQRAGRIDRLGSANEEIHIASFLPERQLEANLGLEQVVRRRIQEFLTLFGEDSHVLPSENAPDPEGAVDAYVGTAFDKAEKADEMDGFGRHAERVLQLRERERSRFQSLRELRPGRRAATDSKHPGIVACRMSWYWAFWQRPSGGDELERIPDLVGLDQLYRHGRAPSVAPEQALTASRMLGAAVEEARRHFAVQAKQVREQRLQPALDHQEEWLRATLESYGEYCSGERQQKVKEMVNWVLAGQYKATLRRAIAHWRKEQLKDEALFQQMLRMLRFPIRTEILEEEETVVAVMGSPSLPLST